MNIIRKISWVDIIDFMEERHSDLKGDITPLFVMKLNNYWIRGDMIEFLKTKGFDVSDMPIKIWALKEGVGNHGWWRLLCGKAA